MQNKHQILRQGETSVLSPLSKQLEKAKPNLQDRL